MIFFVSEGRLGNEIFQYAFLKTQAKQGEKIIALNMSGFKENFEVTDASLKTPITSKKILRKFKKYIIPCMDILARARLINTMWQGIIDDRHTEESFFIKGVLPFTYIKTGYFQSEKFFEYSILEFTFKPETILKAKKILEKHKNFDLVFMHIRRGDYLDIVYKGSTGIDLPDKYFIDGMKFIEKQCKNPFYIVLSDDYQYAKDFLSDKDNKYISNNSMEVDLALMSMCQYGICSNSSFSWWGAKLMTCRKAVVFPKYWFGWKTKTESHPGIQPDWGEVLDF